MGRAQACDWMAIGLRQDLDTLKKWQSVTYVGMGRKSNPDNENPFYKPALWVFNQEFYHKFRQNWQYSFALSYRQEREYSSWYPYDQATPGTEQEFRIYGRFFYVLKTPRIKFVPTIRQEFRKFYNPDFSNASENFQLRTRLRLQLTVNLDKQKQHRLIGSAEELFSIAENSQPRYWSDFAYHESRFNLYYSYSPPKLHLIFDVGYMYNLVGAQNPYGVHYLAFDIIVENPFRLLRHAKNEANENLE